MKKHIFRVFALLAVVSMILAACGQTQTQEVVKTVVVTQVVEKEGKTVVETQIVEVVVTPEPEVQPKTVTINLGVGDIPTLDPAVAEDSNSIQALEETYVGLTRMDEVAIQVVPGMAESWEVSADGLVYTFHLRQDVPWARYDAGAGAVVKVADCDGNDRMVTAYDFEYGTLRSLNPATASPYAYVIAFALQGASDYNNAVTEDAATVGIKALDEYTLEVKFLTAAAYNLNIAGMWPMYAQPRWLIAGDDCTDARGDRWIETGFNQSYGPYVMKEWVHDATMTLVANPFWPGSEFIPNPKIENVIFTMLDDAPALSEYEAGNMDMTKVPLADMDRVKTDPVLSLELNISPALTTYYYGFNTKAPVVEDLRVRRALSMAIDRQSLIDNVTKGNQEPAQWFCRPGLVACPTIQSHPDLGVKYDPAAAKALMDEYLAEKGLTADQLDLTLMFNTSSGHQKIAEAIQQMWNDVLGVSVKLVNQEFRVYLTTVKSTDTPQIWRMGWNLDYPDANNFARENFAIGAANNPTDENGDIYGGVNWRNERFEELVVAAAAEMDPQKRIEMYAEIETIIAWEDAILIPIYWYTSVEVTKPYVARTFANTGTEHIEKWDINK